MGQLRTEGVHLKNDANLFQFYKEQNFKNQKPIKKNGIAAATTTSSMIGIFQSPLLISSLPNNPQLQ